LTEISPGVYRQRIEQSAPIIVRELPGGSMAALATDGTGYLFGLTDEARIVGDDGPLRLELSAITDVHGNRIDFNYFHIAGSDAPLLAAITWNDGRARVDFDYELRPDIVISRALGLRLALAHRISHIRTSVDSDPIRTTSLTYARSLEAPSSRLASIATIAADGAAMPIWRLTYTGEAASPIAQAVPGAPALDPTAEGRAWVDVDGDALPDLIEGEPGAWRYRRNTGAGLSESWQPIASPATSLSPNTRFADITGDGVQDLLAQPTPGELWSFVGGGADPFSTASPIDLDLSFDLTDPHVALSDLNLDGRIDVLRHDDADAWIWLRRRDAAAYEPANAVPPPPAGMRLGDPGVQLADIDGDRIPDLIRIFTADSRVLVAPGAGLGFFDDPLDMTGVPAMSETDRWELADVNGDGAADLLRIDAELGLWVNQLDGSFAHAVTADWPTLEADEVLLVTDIDASGTLDILRVDTDGSQPWRAWSLYPERPGLLARFENGLGYTREHTYRPAAQLAAADAATGRSWVSTPPEPMPVLTETREDDGAGWTAILRRGLRDGWYDPTRGEFRGFAELRDETTGDAYSEAATTTRNYDLGHEDEARALQLLATETRSPRGLLVREAHTLAVDSPAPGIRAVRRSATDTYHVEAGPESAAIRVRTEWDHDAWTNMIEERALGRVDRETGVDIPGDERITTNTYATSLSDDAPRDRIAEQIVMDADGIQVTATRTYYDGDPEQGLPLGQLDAHGAVVRVETWIEADTWVPTLRQTIDAHGNITRVRDAEDGVLERRYDPAGLFPVEERVHLHDSALVTTAEWDARTGHPVAVTAPNGASTLLVFDGLGRLTAEVLPGDSPEFPTRRYTYDFTAGPSPAVTTELRRISGRAAVERSIQHLDGLGRPRAHVTADDSGAAAILARGIVYSADGKSGEEIEGQELSAAALNPGAKIPVLDTWPRSTHRRDALGRTVFQRDADGRETETSYGPLWTLIRDHEDLHASPPYTDAPERRASDGLGRVVEIEQILADRNIDHVYAYDAAGRLVGYTDPAGHQSRYTRDGAGRLIGIDSPDAGHITQHFDATGRIRERASATGARVIWSYDLAGRLERQVGFDATGAQVSTASFQYDRGDDPSAGHEYGLLTAVDDDAGHLALVHDARGRVIRTSRRFTTADGEVSLATGVEFDPQDRPVHEVHPDGTTLTREYTARGLEAPLVDWLDAATRDPRGRWTEVSLAPGTRIRRALDHTGRLQSQQVHDGNTALLDLMHVHDVAGLLAETRDLAAPGPGLPSLDQRFTYDDLHRLTRAEGSYGAQTFVYADDDNIVEFAGSALEYGGRQPHAVTRARDQQLDYDAAGQLAHVIGDGPLTAGKWSFDPHGRLSSFTAEDGRRVQHVYDHAGKEAIRREYDAAGQLAHETLYFTPAAEVRDGQLVRWVFWSGERIAESRADLPSRDDPIPAVPVALGLLLLTLLARVLSELVAVLRRPVFAMRPAFAAFAVLLASLTCGGDGSDALRPDARARFHISDRLGSASLVLDHRGDVVARETHEPFGAPAATWRADNEPGPVYRFAGNEDHALAGAVTIGARHYLSALGRWASPDPQFLLDPEARLERPGERNLYRYAGNNPVENIDPTGYGWFSAAFKLAKAAVKAVVKGIDKVDEFSGIADDAATVVGSGSTFSGRVISGLSLISEVLPVSAGDVKDVVRWARGTDAVKDAASTTQRSVLKALPERTGPVGHLSTGDVRGKTPAEIDTRAREVGLQPMGKDPANGRGSYIDPQTKTQRILSHPNDPRPHGHVNDPEGFRIGPDGQRVPSESPEAHIPIKTE
jgi:RHS repeat-associated protein